MTVNKVRAGISVVASGLIAFAFFQWFDGKNRSLLTGGAFLMIGAGLLGLFAVDLTTERLSANVKVASGLFLILSLCSTVIFSFFDFRVPSYIITNGLFALGYALVLNIIIGEPG